MLYCFSSEKAIAAERLAKTLGCPYKEHELSFENVNGFLEQLEGIRRANELAIAMGVGPIDFSVKTQTAAEYLSREKKNKHK